MLKRWILILLGTLILTMVSSSLPFITKQKTPVQTGIILDTPERKKELLKKEELNEEESAYLEEREKELDRILEEDQKNWTIDQETHKKSRRSTLWYLAILWLAYFLIVPKNLKEVLGSLIFPSLYWAGGAIIGIELVVIICVGLLGSLWVSREKMKKLLAGH